MQSPEKITPYDTECPKNEQVEAMFNHIAGHYDRLNHLFSWGMDRVWRQKAIRMIEPFAPHTVLDVATGTGDLAIEICRHIPSVKQVTGVDLSLEMMRIGEQKVRSENLDNRITFMQKDCLDLPFADHSFDAVTVAFGVRNFQNIKLGLEEMYRVLNEGAPLMILELSRPVSFPWKQGYNFYASHVIPVVGRFLSQDAEAYTYLPESIAAMPQREELADLMLSVGFREAYYRSLSLEVATVYMGLK
ncbi:bifunctional demethylmenaquinone methyltransferase/2-methoxy-6-polyprenyl-1,4-benzoquinol methylase UbiE [Porphyromonas gingivalis]|uniref:bifunctional demethylmenaquinone methyltransferase/2-methoxy-6-polyprenyl-1,4-benzoquinol methylase UbiE n=1 Tax=Porphyromonas gingivalis TaxID=837 RepID=UPI000BE72E5C|nr:bifunctional demethylmenaquinone methyltransferase/2-methoxy-6-polyprenyl-1,4-benzoquinol methylase UbiE [Porphyromonas gingivalis]PDP41407.1 bifunctional demethylmenaquinone methyltransferase/2-methoxy-6-polyprenyl-1,4-benzoquinol methylase UbiE [Porphyromonas gingivalis]